MSLPHRLKAAHFSHPAGDQIQAPTIRHRQHRHHRPTYRGPTRTGPPPPPLLPHPPPPPRPHNQPDEETRKLTKGYFRLLQAVHHKNIIDTAISTQVPPKGMAKHVVRLTAFIKPSTPTDSVKQALADNTTSWMKNNLNILQEHYCKTILTHSNLPFEQRAFQTATNWARKRYRARLTSSTVEAAQSLLQRSPQQSHVSDSLASSPTTSLVGDTPPRVDLNCRLEFPPLDPSQKPPSNPRSLYLGPRTPLTTQTVRLQQKERAMSRGDNTEANTPLNAHSTPCPDRVSRAASTRRDDNMLPPLSLSPVVHINRYIPVGGNSSTCPQIRSHLPPPGPDAAPPSSPPLPPSPGPNGRGMERTIRNRNQNHPISPSSSSDRDFARPHPPRTRPRGAKDHPTGPYIDRVYRSEGETVKTKKSIHKTSSLYKSLQTHTPKLSNVAVLDDDNSFLAITNSPIFSAECVTGPGHVRVPDLGPTSSPRRQPEAGGKNMMKKRQMRHNNVNLMAKAASSDPTSKGTSAGPSRRTSPDTAHAPAEPHTADVGSPPQNGGQRPDDTFCPTYHKARKGNKLVEWQFTGVKSIWFLGDSNLNRVSAYCNPIFAIQTSKLIAFRVLPSIISGKFWIEHRRIRT